ncbi:hypothetical protein KSS87_007053 [Heliosperma pusillum]|nr:hypothetical protein KSS87_007053 [Heliosperma pusillum]
MKALLGLIAWILCAMLVILPILAKPKSPPPPPPPPKEINYPLKTWILENDKPAPYTRLITSLRTELDSKQVCGIPTTTRSPALTKAFILVEITSIKNKNKVTLAFRASNVYYVGYKDELNGVTRANFVKDDFNELKGSGLFANTKIKTQLPHKGGYDNLGSVAKIGTRGALNLGVKDLSTLLETIYGADYDSKNKPKDIGQNLAKFALTAIQMIAEGTRFNYIEEKVRVLGTTKQGFYPDATFLKLENNWGKISAHIHSVSITDKKCGDKDVQIEVPGFSEWKDIKPQMGLLNYN